MATISLSSDGAFRLDGDSYEIPRRFSPREVFSYRRLLEPIPDIPGGTSLDDDQRREQKAFLLRRAAACVIPGLQADHLQSLDLRDLQGLHRWIAEHRPDLAVATPLLNH